MIPRLLTGVFRRALNTFISPAGDGDLLAQIASSIDGSENIVERESLNLLIPVLASVGLSCMIRYVLGDIIPAILALEAVYSEKAGMEESRVNTKRSVTSRNTWETLRRQYRAAGISTFFRGTGAAVLYWTAQSFVAGVLRIVFRHLHLRPLAHTVSSVILSELHLYWTQCMISAPSSVPAWSSLRHDGQRWLALARISFIHGFSLAFMNHVPTILFRGPLASVNIESLAMAEANMALLMLLWRFFIYLPASVALALIEASLLPETQETDIPRRNRDKGAKIGEIFPAQGPLDLKSAFKEVRIPICLWLIELHIKKCLIQFAVESSVSTLVYLCLSAVPS